MYDLIITTRSKHTYYISIYINIFKENELPKCIFENNVFLDENVEKIYKPKIPQYLFSQIHTVFLCKK